MNALKNRCGVIHKSCLHHVHLPLPVTQSAASSLPFFTIFSVSRGGALKYDG